MEISTVIVSKMSSKEIAELTGKRHDHVARDIKHMFIELGISHSPFLGDELSERGRMYPVFYLPKEETLILVSGYSIKMRAKIINRWLELERKLLPQTFSEALRLAADQAQLIEEQKPLVEFAKSIEGTDQIISFGDFAKINGTIGRNNLFKLLRDKKILMSSNIPYQRYVDCEYFEVKEKVVETTSTFTDIITKTTYITGKGQLWLDKKIKEWIE